MIFLTIPDSIPRVPFQVARRAHSIALGLLLGLALEGFHL